MTLAIYTLSAQGDFPWRGSMLGFGKKQWDKTVSLTLTGRMTHLDTMLVYDYPVSTLEYYLENDRYDVAVVYKPAYNIDSATLQFLQHLSSIHQSGWNMIEVANMREDLRIPLESLALFSDFLAPIDIPIINHVVGMK